MSGLEDQIGPLIRAARERRGMSLRNVTNRMRELAGDDAMTYAQLSRIETGSRRASIGDWLLIAAAIDTPPILLLLPLGQEDDVEILPGWPIHPQLAWDWIRGDETLTSPSREVVRRGEWLRMSHPLRAHDSLRAAQDALRDDQPHRPLPREQVKALYDGFAHVLDEFTATGLVPPPQSPFRLSRLAEFGYQGLARSLEPFVPDDLFETPFDAERVPMTHPLLAGVWDMPDGWVDGLRSVGWKVKRNRKDKA